jgi:hypothetical protein
LTAAVVRCPAPHGADEGGAASASLGSIVSGSSGKGDTKAVLARSHAIATVVIAEPCRSLRCIDRSGARAVPPRVRRLHFTTKFTANHGESMHRARIVWLVLLASCTANSDGPSARGESTQAISPFVGFCAEAVPDRWQNQAVAQRTSGVVTIQFDARVFEPEGIPIDAVIGFSDQPAAAFTDLGPILRFNPDGMIDVRNGDVYAADIAMPYRINTTIGDPQTQTQYFVRMVIDMTAHRYSVFVRENTGPELPLASNYAFRSEQANLARIGNVAMRSDSTRGTADFCNGKVTPPDCRSSSATSGWATTATYPEIRRSYIVEVDVIPLDSNIDAIVGLSSGSPSSYSDLAAILRFNSDGAVDARDGDTYHAVQRVPYTANHFYTFVFTVDLDHATYSAWLDDPAGGTSTAVASHYAFRTEQAADRSLGTIGQKVDAGSVTTCDVAITPLDFPL